MVLMRANLGKVCLQTDCVEEAKLHPAQACLAFYHPESPYADAAFRELVQACGSVEATNVYLVSGAKLPLDAPGPCPRGRRK